MAGPLPAATSRHARGLAGFPITWLADGPWPARGPVHVPTGSRLPRLQENSTKAARLTKAGSQLPACHDRKLIELLKPHSTSKPNQLRGLLSE